MPVVLGEISPKAAIAPTSRNKQRIKTVSSLPKQKDDRRRTPKQQLADRS
jgi:hypothetical protein